MWLNQYLLGIYIYEVKDTALDEELHLFGGEVMIYFHSCRWTDGILALDSGGQDVNLNKANIFIDEAHKLVSKRKNKNILSTHHHVQYYHIMPIW